GDQGAATGRLVLGLLGEGDQVLDVLVVDLGLAALDLALAVDRIGRGDTAGLALGVVHHQRLLQRAQAPGIAVAGDRVVVPEDAVVAGGDEVRDGVVDVVLEQLDVAALEVHPALLVQAGAVQALAFHRVEALAHAVVITAVERRRLELAGAGALGQQRLALAVEETDAAIGQGDLGGDA